MTPKLNPNSSRLLMTTINKDLCPTCNEPFRIKARDFFGTSHCANGHAWHTCLNTGKIKLGEPDKFSWPKQKQKPNLDLKQYIKDNKNNSFTHCKKGGLYQIVGTVIDTERDLEVISYRKCKIEKLYLDGFESPFYNIKKLKKHLFTRSLDNFIKRMNKVDKIPDSMIEEYNA